jgi:hypothetical protein
MSRPWNHLAEPRPIPAPRPCSKKTSRSSCRSVAPDLHPPTPHPTGPTLLQPCSPHSPPSASHRLPSSARGRPAVVPRLPQRPGLPHLLQVGPNPHTPLHTSHSSLHEPSSPPRVMSPSVRPSNSSSPSHPLHAQHAVHPAPLPSALHPGARHLPRAAGPRPHVRGPGLRRLFTGLCAGSSHPTVHTPSKHALWIHAQLPAPRCCLFHLLIELPCVCMCVPCALHQEIGLASLGASDEEVKKLASCYWHSVRAYTLTRACMLCTHTPRLI